MFRQLHIDYYLCFLVTWTSSPVWWTSHDFDPLPDKYVQSLWLLFVKVHVAAHVSDIQQWWKQTTELLEYLLQTQEIFETTVV